MPGTVVSFLIKPMSFPYMCSLSQAVSQDRIGPAVVTNQPWNPSDFMQKCLLLSHIQSIFLHSVALQLEHKA